MDLWNEIRTAYTVARLGTVSAASKELGIHRATITRHINSLEEQLGSCIFLRHRQGYTLTETGLDLLRVAQDTDKQFKRFAGRAKGRESTVTGELIITSLEIVSPLVIKAIARFRERHPRTTIRYIVSGRILELDYGEAHIAIRAGAKPTHLDSVVLPFFKLRSTFFAHKKYIDKKGRPQKVKDFDKHHFISHIEPKRMPFFQWLESIVPAEQIILRSQNQKVLIESVMAGLGIGFFPIFQANMNAHLHEVLPPKKDWAVPLWLVTHVDTHRTAKVRAISTILKEIAEDYE